MIFLAALHVINILQHLRMWLRCKKRTNGDKSQWQLTPLLIIPIILCIGVIFYSSVFQNEPFQTSTARTYRSQIPQKTEPSGFLVKTEGCRIPYMDPFDEAVQKYISKEKRVVCNKNKPPLMDSNLTSIYILDASLEAYKILNVSALECCHSSFMRVDSSPDENDNQVKFKDCVPFNHNVKIDTDFVRVTCKYGNIKIYTDFFSFVPLRSKYKNTSDWSKKFSVLMVGLDAVSRLNLHRQMPKTVQILKEIGATEFLGYNKVADNTFPNVVTILTGSYESELMEKCWFNKNDKFDNCPIIWKEYSKNNYSTVFGEDSTQMGIFNFLKKGFGKQPTDYYWGPFDGAAEKEIGNEHRMNVFQCIGSREAYRTLLDYIMKYAQTMYQNDIPYFGLFWGSSLSHDFLNKPQLGDDYYAQFFKQLLNSGVLNNTALIFLSDHGMRWGDIRTTYQGRMEERLPFLFMSLPRAYQQQFHQALINLKENTRKLTTPFDLYETLKDLINPYSLTTEVINERVQLRREDRRAYSLFEPIPDKRTCKSAQIDSHWCTCQMNKEISVHDKIVIRSTNHVVKHLNSLLKVHRECASLKLAVISKAHIHSSESQLEGKYYTLDYTLAFRTTPGGADFEATVRRITNIEGDEMNFRVLGTIAGKEVMRALKISGFFINLRLKYTEFELCKIRTVFVISIFLLPCKKQMDGDESRWRMPPLLVIPLLFCGGIIFYIDIFQNNLFEMSTVRIQHISTSNNAEFNGFLIKTEGCRIPYMDPFDRAVRKYIDKEKPVVCNKNKPPLMNSNLTSIYILNSSLVDYNIRNVSALSCCYSSFKRVDSSPKENDNKIKFYSCVTFKNSVQIDTDFVRVTCKYNNIEVYRDFFAFVPLRTKYKNIPGSSKKLGVLMVGLDAVSRVNLHRQMPKTVQTLREIGATEFLGYNKVADNTFPNLLPVLTGSFESELKKKCWFKKSDKFDKCWFVWDDYSKNNYSTVFGEDSTWMGIFNYVKKGFGKQPTDYYWGPFDAVAEKEIGGEHRMNVFQCIGSREIYKVLLDYIMKYAQTMQRSEIPYFGLFWGSSLSHDYLNKPQLGDDYYAKFFKRLFDTGLLNNTVLIFMSDHGIRWGDIRSTYQGRMEERLPFLFMTLPKAYQLQFHQAMTNLNKNTRKLTTPFDLHETLKDLLNPYSLTDDVIIKRIKSKRGDRRAYSLFEPIPNNRTCKSADIDSHWCTCQGSKPISLNDSFVIEGSKYVVKYLNSLLEGYRQCAKLTLSDISSARLHSSESQLQGNHYSLDYTLVFKTTPGQFNKRMDKDEQRWRPPALLLVPVCLCGLFIFYVDVFKFATFKISPPKLPPPKVIGELYNNVNNDFLVKTEGCQIPYLDPFDQSISQFIFEERKVMCNNNKPPLMESNFTHIYLLDESLKAYDVTNLSALTCCFSFFKRVVPSLTESDHKTFYSKCIKFQNSTKISIHEFIRVTCSYMNDKIYKDFFSFAPVNSRVRSKNLLPKNKSLNVLLIGLDAVSRINLHRQMPKTVEVLQKLDAIELLGYNKIGDNTFPNLIPILTGLTEKELIRQCWPNITNKFDSCPFIWKEYSRNAFVTAFGEDAAWMGMFNYAKLGFIEQPTDYFWDTFNFQSERQIGNQHRMNVDQCVGSKEVYTVLLEYITQFVNTMHEHQLSYFGFFWGSSLSHDYLNKPRLGDEFYAHFLNSLSKNNFLKDTALFFISDHGIRWGAIRATYQGRMEERLPFLFIVLPEEYRKTHYVTYTNLKKNARRLTTPLDLHGTLKDLLNPYSLSQEVISTRVQNRRGDERSFSLFEPVPTNRTCVSAGIESHWCTCQASTDINQNSDIAVEVANFCVQYINSLLEGYAECAKLNLIEVLSARQHSPDTELLQETSYSIDYTVVLQTAPGDGVFESTVRKHINAFNNTYRFSMTGTVSRINLYGSQSACMTDFHLKLYCYCT
ncbi:hypothetical protein FQA39_LY13707 [Lamprigera yunnana]|nr:hypothetical protein FQA39_LY13707 [Lamprigera yunnana]